jgi:FeS assembly SUF system protein
MAWSRAKTSLLEWLKGGEAPPSPETIASLSRVISAAELRERVVAALRTIYDPEIPVNIYDLGLVYRLDVDPVAGAVRVEMTLTAPACPVAQSFPATVENTLQQVEGVRAATVELVWDPPWDHSRMDEAARLALGMW